MHWTEKIASAHLCTGSVSAEKGGTGGSGYGHPQGDMHMVAARLGCERAMDASIIRTRTGGPMMFAIEVLHAR